MMTVLLVELIVILFVIAAAYLLLFGATIA
jgi:hypothetical protein